MQVCQQIRRWVELGFENLRVSVNLSANQLEESDFCEFITKTLNDHALNHSVLEFEVTERVIIKDNERIIEVLEELKNLGFIISIDDFGVDYSSFLNIKKLPVEKIKIDMQFIQGIDVYRKDTAIVEAIINLSHSLGFCVVAEGIETSDQLNFLENRGCDEGQGYLFYKPMPSDQIEEILLQHRFTSV